MWTSTSCRRFCQKPSEASVRRELVREVRQEYSLSERRACGLIRITRWSSRYQSYRDPQPDLRMRLNLPPPESATGIGG
jgi:hypothetical protein